jgi:hypothetical protein
MYSTQQQIQEIKERLQSHVTHDGKLYRVDVVQLLSGAVRIALISYDERVPDYSDIPLDFIYHITGKPEPIEEGNLDALEDSTVYLPTVSDVLNHFYQALLTWSNNSFDTVDKVTTKEERFIEELTSLLNKYSKEDDSNTPDFILATYLKNCLSAFNRATNRRTKWYNN